MHRLSILLLMLAASIILGMSPAYAARQTTWTAEAHVLDLIAGPARTAAYLAPDGSRFAYVKGSDLCLYSIDGEKGDCVTLDKDIHMDLDSPRWSPDGTKLAFSEDFLFSFRDSDIWVYEAESNTLTDMTPTANREITLLTNKDPNITFTVDLSPQWSSDGQSIYFIRYIFNKLGDAEPVFYNVSLTDNAVEEVAPAGTHFAFSVYGFALSPDGLKIGYNLDTQGHEKDGTWFLDLSTKEAKFAAAAVQETAPWAYQFSPEGNLLLSIGVDITGVVGARPPEASPIYTLPVSGGRQQQLNVDSYVFSAGWGPEGSELAYATFDPANEDQQGLYITSQPGKAGEMVLPGRFIAPSGRGRMPIIWAANNTVLLSQVPDLKVTIVHLKQS
ncbi:MAG: hypothetical protein GC179_07560 [Anaerolineaceae bacterium]|nr:hypothetical protein [Anaerolineaceae bacterium]